MNSLQYYISLKSPSLSKKEKFIFVLLSSTYMYLFLVFFQPFGINNYDPYEKITLLFLILVFFMSSIGALLMAIVEFYIWPIISVYINYLIVWVLIHIVWLSSGIYMLYNYLGNWHDMSWVSYFEFLRNISVLTLIPFISLFIYRQLTSLKKSLEEVHDYKHKDADKNEMLLFKSENQKEQLTIPLKNLLYLESQDNYVAIYHLTNNSISKTLMRNTLKNIDQENHHPELVRCHRSYIINLVHLQKAHGNRNKLDLHLDHINEQIPVSRQYINDIYALLID